jgi:hypothetical protein
MKYRKLTVFTLILAITLLSIVPALAAEPAQEPTTCTPNPDTGQVSGTVVAVDAATGTVTVDPGDGVLCTVSIQVDETHPIVLLLGEYYGDLSPATLEDALADVQVCAVVNEDGSYSWAECGSEGAVPVRVTGTNEDGTFTAVAEDGTLIAVLTIDDEAVAGTVQGALETLVVAWTLEEDGSLLQVSEQIAAYHEEGMGFGVLVKLYAIAQESETCLLNPECTVDSLVELFQTGEVGMGQIFKEYGKPQKLGVGHVRQELTQDNAKGNDKVKDKDKAGDDQSGEESPAPPSANKKNDKPPKDNNGLKGICNAISKNGKPKDGVSCP